MRSAPVLARLALKALRRGLYPTRRSQELIAKHGTPPRCVELQSTRRRDTSIAVRYSRSSGSGGAGLSRAGAKKIAETRYGTLFSMTAETSARPGRNEPCRCGSGRKYKHCCLEKDDQAAAAARAKAAAEAPAQSAEDAPSKKPARTPKPQTDQPWKTTASRGFVPRSRTPRKVGGS